MRINTNLTAMNTYTQYTKNQTKISGAVAKLSSGYAINSAADNAAGLAISEKMRAQIRGLDKASANAQDAISLVQSAEGALDSSTEILQRMRELAVQSSSDTNNDSIDRTALQDEFSQLQSELNNISTSTTFNKKNLLDGSLASSIKSVTNQNLANTSLTIDIGNAEAGTYNFSVTTKLKSAAVTAAAPTSAQVTHGTDGYFSAGTGTVGTSAAQSALLNGNYTLSASYSTETNQMTVTATGDNGQSFTSTISQGTLSGLSTGTTLAIKFESSYGANDGFTSTLTLASTISSSTDNFNTLASEISKTAVSVSGGVTGKSATYGVFANLTGAESVELHTGMSSVSFNNGAKVNFNTLTSAAVDTSNSATFGAAKTVTTTDADGVATLGNMQALDNSIVVNGAMTLASASDGGTGANVTATDADGNVFTAHITSLAALSTTSLTDVTTTLTFVDASNNDSFTMDLACHSTAGVAFGIDADDLATANLSSGITVSNAGHNYELTFGGSTTDLSASTSSTFDVESTANAGLTFQVGANEGDSMTINIEKMDANYLGVASASVATKDQAAAAIKDVDSAINQVSAQRATLGAVQNRLQYKIDNLNTSSTNLTSAESQIRDVDMAKEMTDFTNANILSQAATAMLAQANSLPQSVLSLIKG